MKIANYCRFLTTKAFLVVSMSSLLMSATKASPEEGKPWKDFQYQVEPIRQVTKIDGNTIHFDVPLPQTSSQSVVSQKRLAVMASLKTQVIPSNRRVCLSNS